MPKAKEPSDATKAEIARRVRYEPETGKFFWRVKVRGAKWDAGDEIVGTPCAGYRTICVNRHEHYLHRIAVFLVTGVWPMSEVDHVDQDKANNRYGNLRAVDHSGNMRNLPMPRTNTSGYVGVTWAKRRSKWFAQIKIGERNIGLGYFDDIEAAAAARKAANDKHGFHPNHGAAKVQEKAA